MAKRDYGQHCGLANALELVGERWALLIVRDLLVGPRRYTDLQRGLPRIPTNVLSTRLRQLEESGVVRRRLRPRPDNSVVYELTDYGAEIEDAVLALSRWGARALGEPGPHDIVTPDSLVMALRSNFRPDRAGDLNVGYELRAGEIVLHARVDDGGLRAAAGPLPGADLVIEAGPHLRELMAGEIEPDDAVAAGLVRLEGDQGLLKRFVELFPIGPSPARLTAA